MTALIAPHLPHLPHSPLRRQLVLGAGAAAGATALGMPAFVRAQGSREKLKVSVGFQKNLASADMPFSDFSLESR